MCAYVGIRMYKGLIIVSDNCSDRALFKAAAESRDGVTKSRDVH